MNLLDLIRDFTDKYGLPTPGSVVGNTDATVAQIRSLSQEVLRSLRQYSWQRQKVRATFTSVAAEVQGDLPSLFSVGAAYRALVPRSMYNITLDRPIHGPVSDMQWQLLVANSPAGPIEQYFVSNNQLLIRPIMTAGQTVSAFVWTNYGCVDELGTTFRERFAADTDSPLFPDEVFLCDLEWRWLKQKEQPWASAYAEAQRMISGNINKDDSNLTVRLDQPETALSGGIFIPSGSWNV